jgi:hypothetical protein
VCTWRLVRGRTGPKLATWEVATSSLGLDRAYGAFIAVFARMLSWILDLPWDIVPKDDV